MSSELGEWYYFWKSIMNSTNIFRNKQPYDIYTVLSVVNISIKHESLAQASGKDMTRLRSKDNSYQHFIYKVSTQEYVSQDLLTIYWYNRNSSQRPFTKLALKNPTTQPPQPTHRTACSLRPRWKRSTDAWGHGYQWNLVSYLSYQNLEYK